MQSGTPSTGIYTDWSKEVWVFNSGIYPYHTWPIFLDVLPDQLFYPYIMAIYAEGITTGFSDGTYRPNDPVTLGQMAAFLARAFKLVQ